ncbi:MAG: arginine--tRNA ligase [Candidatus Hadarchaeales archaeon]
MNAPWEVFKDQVSKAVSDAVEKLGLKPLRTVEETLEEPPDPKLGDLASTICFELARTEKIPPADLAVKIVNNIVLPELVEKVEPVSGYLNFFAKTPLLAEIVLKTIRKLNEKYGRSEKKNLKVVVEHTSINPTKPLHIGHGRNAILGDTVARIMDALGYEVEVHNYIDDMGRQMAETLVAYEKIKEKPKTKFDHMLGLLYASFHKMLEENKELEKEIEIVLAELEKGEGKVAKRARKLAERCVKENLKTTDKLGISYNMLVWESDLVREGIVQEALDMLKPHMYVGTGEKEGAFLLRLSPLGLEDKILLRSDGTTVYTARDIAYQLWKFGKISRNPKIKLHSIRPGGKKTYTTAPDGKIVKIRKNVTKVINIIGAEQRYPQQVVFAALKLLGYEEEYQNSYHLAYEHVWLPTEKFSGRKGTWVGYSVDEVLDEAIERAYQVVKEHAPNEKERFWRRVAKLVGIGAIRYSLLATSPEKKIVFKWEEALDLNKNSGPAIQYSHARACSILRKAGKLRKLRIRGELLVTPSEKKLIILLAKFPTILKIAGENLQPHLLAVYTSELAQEFNRFYETSPVLTATPSELRESRLALVDCVRIVLRNSLDLMGIPAPEKM